MALNEVIRGDTKKWAIAIVDEDGAAYDLTGCTVWFTAKQAASNVSDDSDATFQHKIVIDGSGNPTSADGFAIGGIHPTTGLPVSGAASGVLTQTLTAAESTTLSAGSYVYDLQIKIANGDIYTPILGLSLTVINDITRSTT